MEGKKVKTIGITASVLGGAGFIGKVVQVVSEVERGSEKEEGGFLFRDKR